MSFITVEIRTNAGIEKVWDCFTQPEHIINWNFAHPSWHTPRATNDLRVGGKFASRMEAKDGSSGFDFEGIYTDVTPHELIAYQIADGRKVINRFSVNGSETILVQEFEAEAVNPHEMQKSGWQAILDNFKKYVEQQ